MKTEQSLDGLHREQVAGTRIPVWVGGLTLLALLIKLWLIDLNVGEYTDGIIQLTLWNNPVVFFPPGYSALCWLVAQGTGDVLHAGRLVSILASVLTLPVLYLAAKEVLKSPKEALWAMAFLALSPIFSRWSQRVMTDALFCFFFTTSLYLTILAWKEPRRSLTWLAGWTGLSVLVRYQGLFFLLPLAWLFFQRKAWRSSSVSLRTISAWGLALLPWLMLAGWIWFRGFGHQTQFSERASQGLLNTAIAYGVMFETYVLYWPWAVTYSLFGLGVLGIVSLRKAGLTSSRFLWLLLLAFVGFLLVQSAFRSFQYRYLLPLLPLWCICAARGMGWVEETIRHRGLRLVVVMVVLLNLAGMSAAVLILQKGTFGDLVECAQYLREIGTGSRVLSDETYREGVYNPKMEFWSGRAMEPYFLTRPQAGDLVVLHNAYSDFEKEHKTLSEQFDLVVLRRWDQVSVPLLPDIMVMSIHPHRLPLTSNPECMAFRFFPQSYSTVLLRLKEKTP